MKRASLNLNINTHRNNTSSIRPFKSIINDAFEINILSGIIDKILLINYKLINYFRMKRTCLIQNIKKHMPDQMPVSLTRPKSIDLCGKCFAMVPILTLFSFILSAQSQVSYWPVIKHYDQDHLVNVALPLGGIGTGTVSLGEEVNYVTGR